MSALLKIKRGWFEAIRRNRLTRLFRNLDNYLENVEVREGLPTNIKKALVLSPHPDDESIGCGGTLALLAAQGVAIDVAFLTAGASEGDELFKATRQAEAQEAAKILGLRSLHFLKGQEGDLHLQPWLSSEIKKLLDVDEYQIVFCPWPHDGHSDHQAAFRVLMGALKNVERQPELWLYEVWAPVLANRVVNIDSVIGLKQNAINAHKSQVSNTDYTSKFLALAKYRSLICRPANYAEAFLVGTRAMFDAPKRIAPKRI